MWLGDVQSEPLFTFLVAGGLFFLFRMILAETPSKWDAASAGVVFGLASLCRPTGFLVGIILTTASIFLRSDNRSFGKAIQFAFLSMACIFLIITPWTILNFRATGEFILLNDAGGCAFYAGNHPINIGFYEGDSKIQTETIKSILQPRLIQEKIDKWEKAGGYWSLSLKQRERLWFHAGWQNLRANPWLTVRLWGYKALDFWRLWLHPKAYPRALVLLSAIFFLTLYLLATWGAALIKNDFFGKQFLLLLGVLFIAVTGIHAITLTMLRYRLPYVEPYLSVLAAPAILIIVNRITTYCHSIIK